MQFKILDARQNNKMVFMEIKVVDILFESIVSLVPRGRARPVVT